MKKFIAMILVLALVCSAAFAETAAVSPALSGQLTVEDIQALNGGAANIYTQDGQVTFIDGTCASEPIKSVEDAGRVVDGLIELLGGNADTHFEPWRVLNDSFGNVYYVFQQTYADIVVLGGAVKIVTDAEGNMLGLTGSVADELPDADELKEQVTAEQAEEIVAQQEIKLHHPEPEIMEGMTRKIVLPVNRELDPDAEDTLSRFVWAVYTNHPAASVSAGTELPYLAHYVTLAGEYLYSLPTILPGDAVADAGYDANYVFQFMEPADYTGYVDVADGSEQEITVTLMRDTRTGMYYLGNIERRIVVADCWEFLYNGGAVVLEYSPDNLEWDQSSLKSLYNYCRAYDYYKAIGWEGGDGQGTPIIILKDFCDDNHVPIDNAAYAGKYCGWQAFLSSSINHYSECLDVLGHEFTHCVTGSVMTYNAYLNDFGAINEAMSDIQGNICEMLMSPTGDETWLIGENAAAIRSMSDPHRFGQPEYSWDVYYKANVKTPTTVNDRGGVHTNSSLLNNLAYQLCVNSGMALEEARAFWFAVDCAMVPGTDYPQLRALLPWVLKNSGLNAYQEALAEAISITRLGDGTLPESLAENQALLTLDLPDTEIFNDGNWMLSVYSLNVEKLGEVILSLSAKINSGDTDDLPKLLRDLLEMFHPKPTPVPEKTEKKGFWETLMEVVEEALEEKAKEDQAEQKAGLGNEDDWKELIEWLRSAMQDVFYTSNGSAGQDGHTVTMMSRPGYTIPALIYVTLEPNSDVLKQLNTVIYLNHHWIDVTGLFSDQEGEEEKSGLSLLLDSEVFSEFLSIIASSSSFSDYVDALALNVKGGEVFEIPAAGLEKVDLSLNMAAQTEKNTEVVNTKSRPKLPKESDLIQEMVVNYGAYGDEADARNAVLLKKLREMNTDTAKRWKSILALWKQVNTDLTVYPGVLPDGLPDTEELCLVVLGFQLNPDGSMKDELVNRLKVSLESAKKYPNAYVVCTGGGTASENEAATEAGKMAEWLIENGLDEKRVIVEEKSLTTAQNAIYTFDILAEKYPRVSQLAIISSDYHIATGTLLFSAEAALRAAKAGKETVKVVSNAAYEAPSGELSAMFQAGALIELSGDVETAFEIYYETYDIHELPPME